MNCSRNKHVNQIHIIPILQVEIMRRGPNATHLLAVILNSHVLKIFGQSDNKELMKDWDGRHGK